MAYNLIFVMFPIYPDHIRLPASMKNMQGLPDGE